MAKKNHQAKTGTYSITGLIRDEVEMLADGLAHLRLATMRSHDLQPPTEARLRVALRERAKAVLALKSVIE
jgi:hypothetical protein